MTSNISSARNVKPMNRKPYLVARLTCEYGSTGWTRLICATCASGSPASLRGVAGVFAAAGSPVVMSDRPRARLPIRYKASKPFASTLRLSGRNPPAKLGLGHDEWTFHVVSPAFGNRLSDALPRKLNLKSIVIGWPVSPAASTHAKNPRPPLLPPPGCRRSGRPPTLTLGLEPRPRGSLRPKRNSALPRSICAGSTPVLARSAGKANRA